MNNLEKMIEMMNYNPGLKEKLKAEIKRLSEAKEDTTPKEIMSKAAKTVFDINLTQEDLDVIFADNAKNSAGELNLDELEKVTGGSVLDFFFDDIKNEFQHEAPCPPAYLY